MLRFSNADAFIDIDLVDTAPSAYAPGDARLALDVHSAGFSGRATAWVERDALDGFRAALATLVEHGRGEAVLTSMSPDVLMLRVSRATPVGDASVDGTIGRHVHAAHGPFWHAVSFGFEVEPSQLDAALRALLSIAPSGL